MTLTDELKILDDKVEANQAQYDLDREPAKNTALSSGEDLGYKPEVVEKVKFEYSSLGEASNNKAKSKTDQIDKTDKINKTGKRNKNSIYNPQYSFTINQWF